MCAKPVTKKTPSSIKKYNKELLEHFYEIMCKIRCFEENIQEKFLAGVIPGFVHVYIGEEATGTGIMSNLTKKDYIQTTHRGHGHTLAKGADPKRMMAEIFGKKAGFCKGKGGSMHIADFSVGMLGANGIVGGGYTLATGSALASKMMGKEEIAVVFFGDGASNRGTFHEAANMAAAWKLPVLFVCENNQWASTTPYRTTTSVEDIADRAQGYGMPGVIVDGNDVFAVYEAAKGLIDNIRKGEGPALLECKTYRIGGHFVGDPEMYRTKEEVNKVFTENDPITRFEERVLAEKMMSRAELDKIKSDARKVIEEAVDFAMQAPEPDPAELYQDLYV